MWALRVLRGSWTETHIILDGVADLIAQSALKDLTFTLLAVGCSDTSSIESLGIEQRELCGVTC